MNEFVSQLAIRSRKRVSPALCVLLCFLTALVLCVSASAEVKVDKKSYYRWTVTMNVGDPYTCISPDPEDVWDREDWYFWTVDYNQEQTLPVDNKSDFYKCFADAPLSWGQDRDRFKLAATGEGTCKLWVVTHCKSGKTVNRTYTFEVKALSSATNPEIPVTSVSLDKTALSLKVGESEMLTATVLPENATDKTLTWKSSNSSVATVENGVVTAKGVGSTTISVSVGTKMVTCAITVAEAFVPVTSVSLDKTALSLKVGEAATLTATVLPENATNKTLTWKSSNSSVASVKDGVVTATGAGSAIITATLKNSAVAEKGTEGVTISFKMVYCVVTVTEAFVPVTSVSLDKTVLSLKAGESATLTATVLPENATNKALTWKSSNSSIASVKDGIVTATGVGSAIILVSAEGVANDTGTSNAATCVVTVTKAENSEEQCLVYGIAIHDESGNSALSIPTEQFQATVSAIRLGGTTDATVILVSYTSDGKFVSMMAEDAKNLTTGVLSNIRFQVDNPSGNIGYLKAFVVNHDFRLLSGISVFPHQRQFKYYS